MTNRHATLLRGGHAEGLRDEESGRPVAERAADEIDRLEGELGAARAALKAVRDNAHAWGLLSPAEREQLIAAGA